MNPSPLLPHSINHVLQYISPPSQLDSPLPPHLVSKPLLQRHHFLNLDPIRDPTPYLCWPSPHQEQAIQLLESFNLPLHDDIYSSFPIQYTSDPVSTYAHVRITPDDERGLRIIFQWDEDEGWKYHNATLMPFPKDSFSSLHDALSSALPPSEPQSYHDFLQGHTETSHPSNDDSYWDSYSQDNEHDDVHIVFPDADTSLASTEDAYWAQYASVQGSGDSTVPSPQTKKRKLKAYHPTDPDQHDRLLGLREPFIFADRPPIDYDASDPLAPPCPRTLARRLAALVTDDALPDDSVCALPSPPAEVPDSTLSSSLPKQNGQEKGNGPSMGRVQKEADENILKESIRHVYRLWKAGRRGSATVDDDELFLNIAREVVADL